MNRSLLLAACVAVLCFDASAQCDPNVVFANTTTNAVCIDVEGAVRTVYANALPNHVTGTFPNPGNPNAIRAQRITLTMCSQPRLAPSKTYLDKGSGSCPFWVFGVAVNGLEFDPIANEFFRNSSTGQLNREWNLNALSPSVNLGLDMNQAHVQPNGKYHYHGDPTRFIEVMEVASDRHSPIIGYAADGFPIYYRYVYADPTGASTSVVDATSGYTLRPGTRPGDGVSAPNGVYDGTYTQDYQYSPPEGCLLDECNGRFAVTPDHPAGTYYYVLTSSYPVIPRCLSGVPDKAFTIGPPPQGCATSTAAQICTISSVDTDPEALADGISISPNPATDRVRVTFTAEHLREHVRGIRLFDQRGRLVHQTTAIDDPIDVSALAAGHYYIRIDIDGAEFTTLFIKP